MGDRDPVEVLADEFVTRFRNGEHPLVDEYAQKYPDFATQIRETFPVMLVLEGVAADDEDEDEVAPSGIDLASGDESQRILGDYRIIGEVGRGGMGIVYEAEQLSLGRHVALKVLPKQALLRPKQRKRFEQESRAAAALHHTNIVPVFGVGEHDGTHYYVMQHIQGLSLHDVLVDLKRLAARDEAQQDARRDDHSTVDDAEPSAQQIADTHGSVDAAASAYDFGVDTLSADSFVDRLTRDAADIGHEPSTSAGESIAAADTNPQRMSDTFALSGSGAFPWHSQRVGSSTRDYWRSIARVGMQVADALNYAHGQGVAHRDIKPGNLLLDTRGTVWVTDFGLAKTDEQEDLTNTGDVVGTLRYMAPEALDGKSDSRSDIYSLGLTLYELLALQPAFDEADRKRLIRRIAEEEPRGLRKLNPRVPRDLETIINKAIHKEPQRRYRQAGELAEDLRRFINDEPIRARRIGVFERMWRWCRRNPAIAWTTTSAIVAIAVTIAVAFVMITNEKNAALQLAEENETLALEKTEAAERERIAKELAQSARKEAEAVAEFLSLETYDAASSGRTQDQELTVHSLLDWSAERVAHEFDGRPTQEAAARHALGRAYYGLSLYENALEQFSRALEIRRRELGLERLATLDTMANLSLTLHDLGRNTESRKAAEKAVTLLTEVAGPEHPTTLDATNNLALSLYGLGEYQHSAELSQQTLDAQTQLLGADHPDTLASMNTLGMCLHRLGKYADAQRVFTESLDISRRVLGPEHRDTIGAMSNLAVSHSSQGDYAAAQEVFADCLETLRRVLGPDHRTTLDVAANLAVALQYQGKHDEAEPVLRSLLDSRRETSGEDHWRTGATQSQLGASLTALHRFEEAEALLVSGYQSLSKAPEAPKFNISLALQRIVALYRTWNKPEEAAAWQAKLSARRTPPPSKKE